MPTDQNIQLLHFLNGLAGHYSWADRTIVFFAEYLPFLLFIVAIGILVRRLRLWPVVWSGGEAISYWKRVSESVFAALAAFAGYAAAAMLKSIFTVPRPFEAFSDIHQLFSAGGFSLPSEHAATFAALAVVVSGYDRRAGILFGIAAVLIGTARVAGGVHYPLDIGLGLVIGSMVAWTYWKRWYPWLAKKGIIANERHIAILPKNL